MLRPLLLDTDMLRLHADFIVYKNTLIDHGIDISHGLRSKGALFCRFLQEWQTMAATQIFCTERSITTNEMNDSLAFLHSIGGLEYQHASFWRRLLLRAQFRAYGVRFAAPLQRYSATPLVIFYGVFRACRTVIGALFCLLLLFWAAGMFTPQTLSIIFVYTSGLLIGSVYFHELAHFVRLPDRQQVRFIQQGMRCGLAHKPYTGNHAMLAVIGGPISGFMICSAALVLTIALNEPLLTGIAACLSLIHITALLPWYGDGRSLRTLLRHKTQVEATS